MKLPTQPGDERNQRRGAPYRYSPRMAEAMGLPRTGRLPLPPAPAGHAPIIVPPPVLPIPAQRKPKK